jgi:ferritin-like metal-binding protein YciE
MADQTAGQAKLVQYLTEAHGKETELIQSLTAHIEIAQKDTYKKRLKDHLKETKQHAKLVERRVKKLGGDVEANPVSKIVSAATKTPATAVKGVGHAIRGTGEEEKQLKNAKTEYWNEHEEIANYTAIEILATELGDKETAKVAKQIRREEERMASFLEKQIAQLTKAVVRAEIPKEERASTTRRSSSRKSSSRASSSRKTGASSSSSSRTAKRASSSTRKSGSTRKSTTAKSTARKTGARKTTAKKRS